MVGLDTEVLQRWVLALPIVFEGNLERLNGLDTQAGDGDHGTTILRGVQAAARATESLPSPVLAKGLLETAGSAFRRAAGGASGPLFACIFTELAKMIENNCLSGVGLAQGLENAALLIHRLGKAEIGDRTLLDALFPAAQAAKSAPSNLGAALDAAMDAAEKGVAATATMVARKGRARFVNAGEVHSPDAGATSIELILRTLNEVYRS
ncbi:MAG: DAK2 domain-containing protein [Thermaceae bacterium]|nr:DAK2 domain-containing protein [Thermaceae bacterium]